MRQWLTITSILVLFLLVLTEAIGLSWHTEILFRACQPQEIHYQSFDPYCLSIRRRQQTLNSKYEIWVTKKNDSDYGHVLSWPLESMRDESSIQKTDVVWNEEGVNLSFVSGHRLHIPKSAFIGGR